MNFESILSLGRTRCGASVSSRKKLLELLAECACNDNPLFEADELFSAFRARERLGSTGIGQGIAIPHCRSSHCEQISGILMTLENSIDYDSVDDINVDLVFALIVPEEANDEHVKVLGMIASKLNDPAFQQQLRSAKDCTALFHAAVSG